MKRYRLHKGKSRKLFKHTARKVHKKNMPRPISRGGTRL